MPEPQSRIPFLEHCIQLKQEQVGPQGKLAQEKHSLIGRINQLKEQVTVFKSRMFLYKDREEIDRVMNRILQIEAQLVRVIDENHRLCLEVIRHLENAIQYYQNFNTFALAQAEEVKARELVFQQVDLDKQTTKMSDELTTFIKVLDRLENIQARRAGESVATVQRLGRAA